MANLDLNIGADVECKDGSCGRLLKVVVDPHTKQVTDLVVSKGRLFTTERVVPLHMVQRATPEAIEIELDRRSIGELPEFREREYTTPADVGGATAGLAPDQVIQRVAPGSDRDMFPAPVAPLIRHHFHEGITTDRTVIRRGTRVDSHSGTLGRVDHLLVNRQTGDIDFVVVNTGVISDAVLVPAELLEQVNEEVVYVRGTRDDLARLPRHAHRRSEDVLREVEDVLQQAGMPMNGVGLAISEGVLRLTGAVPDVQSKRRIESLARSVVGVVDVENRLETGTLLAARVTQALATDPHTDVALIEVIPEGSTITLRGRVDSEEQRRAAEGIARQQPGVLNVINALVVSEDEDSERLRFRPTAAWALSHDYPFSGGSSTQ